MDRNDAGNFICEEGMKENTEGEKEEIWLS